MWQTGVDRVDRFVRRDFALPAVVVAVQLVAWPFGAMLLDVPVSPWAAAAVVTGTLVVGVALACRRVAPIVACVLVLVGVRGLAVLGLDGESAVTQFTDLFTLFAVALYRTVRVSVLWWAIFTSTAIAVAAHNDTRGLLLLADSMIVASIYAVVAAYGRARRRWWASREAVATRLARVEDEERHAAAMERERLMHELHDVAAHHLTAIIVQLAAAARLAGRSPGLVDDALRFAVSGGHETVASLRRLVALAEMTGPAPSDRPSLDNIADLTVGVARLGLPVRYTVEGVAVPSSPEVGVAAYRITQEALTNALRYAGNGPVSVRLVHAAGSLRVHVDDEGPESGGTDFDLGSGGGVAGMRTRAGRLGGTLTAGPRPGGGWSVCATLPVGPSAGPAPAGRRVPSGRTRPRHVQLFDAVTAVLTVCVPLLLAFVIAAEESDGGRAIGGGTVGAATVVALMLLQGVLLWWRRPAPLWVLGGILAVLCAWTALARTGILPTDVLPFLVTATFAVGAAVYAVGRYDRNPALNWLAVPVTAGVCGLLTAVVTSDPNLSSAEVAAPGLALFVATSTAVALTVTLAPIWLGGFLIATHRSSAVWRDTAELESAVAKAADAARAERARIAEGLSGRVLRQTQRMIAAAGADRANGDRVAEALAEGRAALTAMRELLTVLRVEAGPGPRAPQPTLAGLAELCRAVGGPMPAATLEVHGGDQSLPLEVELCAFRVVEAILPIGAMAGHQSARVAVDCGPGVLRLAADRLAAAPSGEVMAAVRERVDAVGGSLSTATSDLEGWRVEVSLPITEVVPSQRG